MFVIISVHEIQSRLCAFPSSVRDEGGEFRLSMGTNLSWPQQMKAHQYKGSKYLEACERAKSWSFKASISAGKLPYSLETMASKHMFFTVTVF